MIDWERLRASRRWALFWDTVTGAAALLLVGLLLVGLAAALRLVGEVL